MSGASGVGRDKVLQAFQAAAQGVFEQQLQPIGIFEHFAWLGLQDLGPLDRRHHGGDALVQRLVQERLAVEVHHVEDHRFDR